MSKNATPRGAGDGQAASTTEQTSRSATPDWETIECEYRAGLFSVREIAKRGRLSEGAIRKRAKAHGWLRDLTAKVQDQVRAQLVRSEVRTEHTRTNVRTEREIVDDAAATVVEVVKHHRRDIRAGREIVAALLAQLTSSDLANGELEELIEQDTAIDKDDTQAVARRKLRERSALLKAISLPERAGTIKELSLALKNLIAVERQAYNVDTTPPPPPEAGDADVTDAALVAFEAKLNKILGDKGAGTAGAITTH